MKSTKKHIIDDHHAIVIDNFFAKDELREVYIALASSEYKLWFVQDSPESDEYQFLQAHYAVKDFLYSKLGSRLTELVKNTINKNCNLERVFTMCLRYGDQDYYHKDYFKNGKGVSLVLYSNVDWKPDWGGETFFEINKGVYKSFSIKPGRILIFDGTIKHKAGVPSRHSQVAKLSLNLRFSL